MGTSAEAAWSERVNRLLDRLPGETLRLGAREVPAFRSLGVLGFHLALLTALLTGLRAGVPALDVMAIAAVAAASFFGWALLRRAVTGRETLVLLEHVWIALGAVALLRWVSGAPILPGLDVLCVALCPFLVLGRIGCLVAGCCHGQPAALGIVYPPSAGRPARLAGVRLFPAPLVEAAALAGIGLPALVIAGGPPGAATVWVLAAYATVRFGTEALRGDARPALAGLSVPRLMCAAQLAAALVLSELVAGGHLTRRIEVAAAILSLAGLAGVVLGWRRRDPLSTPVHLDEVWARIGSLAQAAPAEGSAPSTADTSAGVRLAASWGDYGLHVSFSHPSRPVTGLPHALGLAPLASTGIATHVIVSATRLPAHRWAIRSRRPDGYDQASDSYDQTKATRASGNGTGTDYFGDHSIA